MSLSKRRKQVAPSANKTTLAISKALRQYASPQKAAQASRFFRSGPGQYGEGDRFLGLTVPEVRKVVRAHRQAKKEELVPLLYSPWHEERLCAFLILVEQVRKLKQASDLQQALQFTLKHRAGMNNWDLVDVTAEHLLGRPLLELRNTEPLRKWTQSSNLWDRRRAIVSTFAWLRIKREVELTIEIAELLVQDEHDLMHKAVGWLLREAGKRDLQALRRFLDRHQATMPRTMLRYAIEKMSPRERQQRMSVGRSPSKAKRA